MNEEPNGGSPKSENNTRLESGSEENSLMPWIAKVWATEPPQNGQPQKFLFPEQVSGAVSNPKTGICFSGGGTRSLTACLGQLRALSDRGLLDQVGYLSCVSGGSWAATAFTYNPTGSDTELLGPVVRPENLTFDQIRSSDVAVMGKLGQTALQSGFNRGEELWNQSFQSDLLWYEVVGEFFFKPLGLFNPISGTKATEPEEQAYFSFDSKTVADIKARNPALANKHFFCVREAAQGVSKRPFLIANATFMGPQGVPNRPTLYAGLEMTPLYVGAPNIFKIDYPTRTPHLVRIVRLGGGFLETFAFGTVAPAKLPSLCPPSTASSSQDGSSCVGLTPPKRHFNMVEASALASAFYAQLLASYLNDTSFTMVRDVWPVSKTPLQPAGGPLPTEKDYFIGDGGLLENYGVISLLLRGVEKIVVFVNTSTILDIHYNGTTAPEASQVDSLLPQLFGQALADGTNPNSLDHVFELKKGTVGGSSYDGFAEVVQGLVAAKKRDKAGPGQWAGVVSQNRLRTVPNDNWGLPGGREVEVLWVYLDRVNQWEKLLPSTPDPKPAHDFARPWTFKKYIEYGNGLGSENPFGTHYGPVAYFPTYSLAYENNDLEPDFQLTPFQVNLMSNLTWWVVDENAAMLKQWLS